MKFSRAQLVLAALALWATTAVAAPPAPASNALVAPAAPAVATAVLPPPPAPVVPPSGPDLAADLATLQQLSNQAAATSSDDRLAAMAGQVATIENEAQAVAAARQAAVAALDRSIARIVPRRRHALTPAERAALAPLEAQRASLAPQLAQAQGVVSAARGAYSEIAERRREGFSARVLARSDSPVSPRFWDSLGAAVGTDNDRLATMTDEAVDAALAAPEPRGLLALGGGLVLAFVLAFPVRWRLERLGRRKSGEEVNRGFAHTGAGLWVAAVDAGIPTLVAAILQTIAQWAGLLSPEADALSGAAVVATAWAASIMALGRVLATERDASQRLLRISNADARRMRLPLLAVALVTAAGFLLTRLDYVVGASVAATIAANCGLSLAYAGVAAWILLSFSRGHRGRQAPEPEAEPAGAPAWTLIALLLSLAIAITFGAVFAGYTTLAALTASQIFWLSIIAACAYLAMRFVDDLCAAGFGDRGRAMRTLTELFLLRRSTIRQTGVLVSAALQILVLIGALSLALTPFGRSGDLLFANLSELGRPIKMGSATVSLSALAAGVATFVIGLALAHAAQRWIVRRYLPATDWDSGLRNSVTTGVGYVGVGLALACALAASGLGIGQIALIASALSVGIGFGLQQVVQNFVSGVILLVERPVKVGDWINIGGVEGDIRRIRVRATEIETFDRSTVIVPNSDFITKQVQNRTLGEPVGRILLQLSITRPTDAAQARELILKVAAGKKEIVTQPAPGVFIDSIAPSGAVNLSCFFYVAGPRHTYRVRSECYFDIMYALEANDIPFAGLNPPTG